MKIAVNERFLFEWVYNFGEQVLRGIDHVGREGLVEIKKGSDCEFFD